MIELDLHDATQEEIRTHLGVTERLLSRVASQLSRANRHATIYLMPDLGLPRGVGRIHGGFFNGAVYSWETTVPFVPVDATVNCCGTSAFRLSNPLNSESEFLAKVTSAQRRVKGTPYSWNFNSGNHFISYGDVARGWGLRDGAYAVLHSSAAEFKRQYNGLYPDPGNWFASEIKTLWDDCSGRYIRYVEGRTAERFFGVAKMLEEFNRTRHQFMAGLIFGEAEIAEEVLNIQHYGMPGAGSVAIGCQWVRAGERCLLLTDERSDLYFVRAAAGGRNTATLGGQDYVLMPHGLGNVILGDTHMHFGCEGLSIGGREFPVSHSLEFGRDIALRSGASLGQGSTHALVREILSVCPGEIMGTMRQAYNYNRDSAPAAAD
ncbi:hypothetical protein FDZ71_00035 [bacterium]|nr:MAG: hypothetical protein FDZ71_00035 [bacterium]